MIVRQQIKENKLSKDNGLTTLEKIIVNIIIYAIVLLCYKYLFGMLFDITFIQSFAIVGLILITKLIWSVDE